jgi:hypothetical protein
MSEHSLEILETLEAIEAAIQLLTAKLPSKEERRTYALLQAAATVLPPDRIDDFSRERAKATAHRLLRALEGDNEQ